MIDRDKRNVLGVQINVIDYEGVLARIFAAVRERRRCSVSAVAVHGVMTGVFDPTHKYRLNRLDVVTPDGQPVRWALRLLHGEKLPDRVYGPNLTKLVCARAAEEGVRLYLYGSRQEVLEAWTANLRADYPNLMISGAEPSKFRKLTEEEDIALDERIRESGAGIVFVGLGCPRQEVFAYEHTDNLHMPVLAVGAAFDFHAGLLRQAPGWMQDRGLEWLFRLIAEPRRLWRRYIILNPVYCFMIARQYLRLQPRRSDEEQPPVSPLRYG